MKKDSPMTQLRRLLNERYDPDNEYEGDPTYPNNRELSSCLSSHLATAMFDRKFDDSHELKCQLIRIFGKKKGFALYVKTLEDLADGNHDT